MFDWLRNLLSKEPRASQSRAESRAAPQPSKQQSRVDESIAHKKLGDAHFDQGKFIEAAASYKKAVACNPEYAEAYCNWGNVCRELNLIDDAERYLRKAADLKPALPNVHYNLASFLLEVGKHDEAMASFAREVARDPKHYAALALMLNLKQKNCDWRDLDVMTDLLRAGVLTPAQAPEQVFSPFVFMVLPGTTREEQKLCAERWTTAEYQSLVEIQPRLGFIHNRRRNAKIALGYLSADFHDHATARLIGEVFELHDPDRFRITAYSYGPDDGSKMRKRLKASFDEFVDLRNVSDIDAARRIYSDQTDILIDLKGYTRDARSGILALRPAPCQINYLGYPGTMGANFIDYIVADPFIVPHEHQPHYTEKILQLPRSYQPNDRTRVQPVRRTREQYGLPNDSVVFCCFNQTYKITPEIFDIWCRLMTALPASVLWLHVSTPAAEENLKREASARGINSDRLIIAPPIDQDEHLARLQCADLFLDTLPINAHTTCSDALWMGLPVVTCSGDTFPSRVAGSLLSAIGLPELIAYNLDDYYRLALDLAAGPGKLKAVKDKLIAQRNTAPLFDSVRFTRDLEALY